ncbi:MAG: peptidoglycan-binding protein [Candidatus Nomurabacteria bacterium]|nr:peptidoglycan-binding protein [Candidatus Nomurabacteria bacterium]
MKRSTFIFGVLGLLIVIGLIFVLMVVALRPDKNLRQLFSEPQAFFNFGDRTPFVLEPGEVKPVKGKDTTGTDIPESIFLPRLQHVTAARISGVSGLDNGDVRYVQQVTGHVFDIDAFEKTSTQITDSSFPETQEIYWTPDGGNGWFRFYNDTERLIETFAVSLESYEADAEICSVSFGSEYVRGDRGDNVRAGQKTLAFFNNIPISFDGVYGGETSRAITTFQIFNDLEATGNLDEPTRNLLNEKCTEYRAEQQNARSEPVKLGGSFMPQDILSFAVSHDGKSIAYVQDMGKEVVVYRSGIDGRNPKELYRTSFKEWYVVWGGDDVVLATKPTGTDDSFVYRIQPSGRMERVLGGTGMTVLPSPDGSRYLFQEINSEGIPDLFIYKKSNGKITSVGNGGLPEKCVWSKNNVDVFCAIPDIFNTDFLYPDEWYQGKINFFDSLWHLDTESGTMDFITSVVDENGLDVIQPTLDANEKYLYFINKNDMTLWSYRLFN